MVRDESKTQKQLFVIQSDGSEEKAISPIGNPFFAEWSWNGNKIAYEFSNSSAKESQGGVFVYDLLTDKRQAISSPYPRYVINEYDGPIWSPDNRYLAYQVKPEPSRNDQMWMADIDSGKYWHFIPDRGEAGRHAWNYSVPPLMTLMIEASGDSYDVATVDPFGKHITLLTNVDGQSVGQDDCSFSPDGQWVTYTSSLEMTQSEQQGGREDCWIARVDGTEARNLTKASSPSTEKQLLFADLYWAYDGRWILGTGFRLDNQGMKICTWYLIDPVHGGYKPIFSSYPRIDGEYNDVRVGRWSWDSTKILFLYKKLDVKNWGAEPQYENRRWHLGIYDLESEQMEDILTVSEKQDRKIFLGNQSRSTLDDVTWSPDNRSILMTIGTIISQDESIYQPDVYRVDLPDRLIGPNATESIGPPIDKDQIEMININTNGQATPPDGTTETPNVYTGPMAGNGDAVTEIVQPVNLTIDEAMATLPAIYQKYFTSNSSRNLFLFKGPGDVLAEFKRDLVLIDTPCPHILVDLMAVELSDEANRQLGLDWTYAKNHLAFFQPVGNAIRDLTPAQSLNGLTTYPVVGQAFYQGVGRLPEEFFLRLSSLVEDGQATILANPRTVAMSGKESSIEIRNTVNFFFNEGYDTSGRPIVKKSDISSNTKGQILPTLLPNGKIHLLVDVGVGSFTFTPDAGLPEQTSRESKTEVTVSQGQTIVIGGLRQQEATKAVIKVPILGDIPLIGALFKKEETHIRHSVLTIFITPQVMVEEITRPDWPAMDPNDYKMSPISDAMPWE